MCIVSMISVFGACGGKVIAENQGNGGGGGSTGSSCPLSPQDPDVQNLAGKACSMANQVCASNNGCGGCSVTCVNGVWKATSADNNVCFSIGTGC
jgi:hypothetical protein